jgi:hypothetical protein
MLACHRLERKAPGSVRDIRAMLIALLCLAFVAYYSVPSARIFEAAVPFTPRLMAAIGGDRLFIGDGGREIRSYSTNGDLERALRSARAPVPVTQEDIDRRTEVVVYRLASGPAA